MRLNNKVAVITGGSRGIGFATAQAFAREGACVVITASTEPNAQAAAEKLRQQFPNTKIQGISPDLKNYDEVKKAFDEIYRTYGRLDILVNNAGLSESTLLTNYTDEIYDKIMDLNVKSVFYCSKATAEIMAEQGSGVILNTSSMVSRFGQSAGFAYPTSKFAVDGMTLSLARELAPKGIRVNAVAPGITETDMMKAVPKSVIDPLVAQIPLGRLGQPEDIANAFVFLASEEASYISGIVLRVDGLARS